MAKHNHDFAKKKDNYFKREEKHALVRRKRQTGVDIANDNHYYFY